MSAPETSQEPSLKRRRVAKACQSCRSQKSKCDGRHPVCGRCEGYGHVCSWSEERKDRAQKLNSSSPAGFASEDPLTPSSGTAPSLLHAAIRSYDKLVKDVRMELPETSRAAVDLALSHIRLRLPAEEIGLRMPNKSPFATALPECHSQNVSTQHNANRQRYLGEASDVRFFHSIRQMLRDKSQVGGATESDIQSYDQGVLNLERRDGHDIYTELPTRDVADAYVDIYFFTIHIAYPFICKSRFMALYERFWKGDLEITENSSWLPLMYTIFAIGDYYTSFPRSENAELKSHLQYFRQAISLSGFLMTDCTLENIEMLLAQCFFLLATGQSDRCWNTLGLAIRVAQSIGLHVEDALKQPATGLNPIEQETRRRTWYSLYVLDRLLALQLGRPVAIHEEDYRVDLPSDAEDSVSISNRDGYSSSVGDEPSPIDYFVFVIKFSKILGQVISEVYRPSQVTIDPDRMLVSTAALDEMLIMWKLSLPRHLRFDLGHTFEKSIIFKRQRNMLAIKFHHLRTLMHRPYLCLAWLQRHNRPLMALLDRARDRVHLFEKICVLEAQQTAHLLYDVADERSLVHDFPWWQMISCLLCASSVLLVARSCVEPGQADAKFQSQALDEDAEVCLKVFDALSANSDAARRARDMMKGLRIVRILSRNTAPSTLRSPSMNENAAGIGTDTHVLDNLGHNGLEQRCDCDSRQDIPEWQTWPGDLSDPMLWSAQFIDPSQSLHFNSAPISEPEISMYAPI